MLYAGGMIRMVGEAVALNPGRLVFAALVGLALLLETH